MNFEVYCRHDTEQTYRFYLHMQWMELMENFYGAHGNGD